LRIVKHCHRANLERQERAATRGAGAAALRISASILFLYSDEHSYAVEKAAWAFVSIPVFSS